MHLPSFKASGLVLSLLIISAQTVISAPSPAEFVTTGTVPYVVNGETFQTYYEVHGFLADSEKPPIVLVHGGPGFTHQYLSPLAGLAKPYKQAVIFYDQIGNGKSSHITAAKNGDTSFWGVDLYINELANLVEKLGLKEYHLLGHSWGAPLVADYAIHYQPPGLKSLIVTNGVARYTDAGRSQLELVATLPNAEEVLASLQVGFDDPPRYEKALYDLHKQYGFRFVPEPIPEDLRVTDTWFGPDGDTTAFKNMAPLLNDYSIVDTLNKVNVPTLVITGKYDMLQYFCSEPFLQEIPQAKWKQFEKSSHVPFWEEKADYIAFVENWVGNVTP